MPLGMFERICGPEENMKFKVDNDGFKKYIKMMINDIKNNWDVPPLIINFTEGKFELNDGNNRYEALVRCSIKEHYVIIWITDYNDVIHFKEKYSKYL